MSYLGFSLLGFLPIDILFFLNTSLKGGGGGGWARLTTVLLY